jgi:hypothetical protein
MGPALHAKPIITFALTRSTSTLVDEHPFMQVGPHRGRRQAFGKRKSKYKTCRFGESPASLPPIRASEFEALKSRSHRRTSPRELRWSSASFSFLSSMFADGRVRGGGAVTPTSANPNNMTPSYRLSTGRRAVRALAFLCVGVFSSCL